MRESAFTVRNLARDPLSRTARKLRSGNYTGFVLSSGRRIRRAGARSIELAPADVLTHLEELAVGIRNREIEVKAPDGRILTTDEFLSMARGEASLLEESVEEVVKELVEGESETHGVMVLGPATMPPVPEEPGAALDGVASDDVSPELSEESDTTDAPEDLPPVPGEPQAATKPHGQKNKKNKKN